MGMKMAEQPLMMKPGISSSLTDFEGFSPLMALQTSASETGASVILLLLIIIIVIVISSLLKDCLRMVYVAPSKMQD
jgi:hypothetical protein